MVTSSLTPGAAAVSSWKMRLPPSRPASVPERSWWRSHSSIARCGIDRQPEQVGVELDLVVVSSSLSEQPEQALLLGHLDHDGALAAPRSGQPERRGDRGLAGPALAHDQDQPSVENCWHSQKSAPTLAWRP